MQIPVLIEPLPGKGFRARGGEPFAFAAEGATREEAVQRLREQIEERMSGGAELRTLSIPPGEHPWAPFAGMFKDDPLFDEWQEAIREYRRQVDEDPDAP